MRRNAESMPNLKARRELNPIFSKPLLAITALGTGILFSFAVLAWLS